LKVLSVDLDGDTPAGEVPSAPYLCVTNAPTFSGLSKGSVEMTCTETALDDWGNLFRVFESNGVVDPGNMVLTLDWDINSAASDELVEAVVRDIENRQYRFEFPESKLYSTGPMLTYTGHCVAAGQSMPILYEGNTRLTRQLTFKLSGDYIKTPGVART
jgi:hypothetical protein